MVDRSIFWTKVSYNLADIITEFEIELRLFSLLVFNEYRDKTGLSLKLTVLSQSGSQNSIKLYLKYGKFVHSQVMFSWHQTVLILAFYHPRQHS